MVLRVAAINGATFSWRKDGAQIDLEHSAVFSTVVTTDTPGIYAVTIVSQNGVSTTLQTTVRLRGTSF